MADYNVENYETNRERSLQELPTHLSGLRIGPICHNEMDANTALGKGNFTTSGMGSFLNRGAYIEPFSSYFNEESIALANTDCIGIGLTAANNGFLPIVVPPGNQLSRVFFEEQGFVTKTLVNRSQVLRFKCPQSVSFTRTGAGNALTLTVTGYDAWGQLQQEQLDVAAADATSVETLKTYLILQSIQVSVSPGAGSTLKVGLGRKYGFQYFLKDQFYINAAFFNISQFFYDLTIPAASISPYETPTLPDIFSGLLKSLSPGDISFTYIGTGDAPINNLTVTNINEADKKITITFDSGPVPAAPAATFRAKFRLPLSRGKMPLSTFFEGDSDPTLRGRGKTQTDVRGYFTFDERGKDEPVLVTNGTTLMVMKALVFGYIEGADMFKNFDPPLLHKIIGYKSWTVEDDN